MESKPFRWVWPAALLVFIAAGISGALFRMWMLSGFPAGLLPENVRHAHSHLMYFGWVTPLLMALIAASMPKLTGRPLKRYFRRRINAVIGATFFLALLSFVPFLLYGYSVAEIGGKRIPISMIIAGLNVIPWYWFAAVYRRMTKGVERGHALLLTDASVLFLVLSSFGAWGLAVMRIAKLSHPFWDAAMIHAFLDLFAGGWLVFGLLGVAYTLLPYHKDYAAWAGTALACAGLPLAFILMIPMHISPAPARLASSVGATMFALGIMLHCANLWPQLRGSAERYWRMVLVLLLVVAGAKLAIANPVIAEWAGAVNFRILFLHLMLLGFVTLGLLLGVRDVWEGGRLPGYAVMAVSVMIMLVSLVPLTGFWPAALFGRWVLSAAAFAAFLPVAGAIAILLPAAGAAAVRVRNRWLSRPASRRPEIRTEHPASV